jgi:hypothetical protein
MDKREREFRLLGTGNRVKEGGGMMRFAGIEIGAERHMVAVLDEQGEVLYRSSPFCEDAPGYACSDSVTEELRELERLRERVAEDFADRLRQLHRAVDLGFPEFTRYVRTLESQLAATILSRCPTAASFRGVSVKKLGRIVYDGSHKIHEELARNLIEAAERSAGAHHSEPYRAADKMPL